MDCCYSKLLDLLRVKTQVCSYDLYVTPFMSYPSHLTLVKLIKLKRTQTVCVEKGRKGERKRGKTERNKGFFFHFFEVPPKKNKNALGPGPMDVVPWCPGTRVRIQGGGSAFFGGSQIYPGI